MRQLPVQLLRYFITEGLFALDAIRFFQCGDVEPAFVFFLPGDFSGAISDQSVD